MTQTQKLNVAEDTEFKVVCSICGHDFVATLKSNMELGPPTPDVSRYEYRRQGLIKDYRRSFTREIRLMSAKCPNCGALMQLAYKIMSEFKWTEWTHVYFGGVE